MEWLQSSPKRAAAAATAEGEEDEAKQQPPQEEQDPGAAAADGATTVADAASGDVVNAQKQDVDVLDGVVAATATAPPTNGNGEAQDQVCKEQGAWYLPALLCDSHGYWLNEHESAMTTPAVFGSLAGLCCRLEFPSTVV